jgi:hypothetical protein
MDPMKTNSVIEKTLTIALMLAFCAALAQARTPSKTVDYSGNWKLDFGQTKNPPPGLQEYSMEIKQDGHQLKVDTTLQGDLQPAHSSRQYPGSGGGVYPGSAGGGYPVGRRGRGGMGGDMGGGMGQIGLPIPGGGGMGMPGGGVGMPGGGGRGGRPRPNSIQEGNPAAYKLYLQTALYNLDGSESTAQFGDQGSTEATSKAEWGRNGELKFSLVGKDNSGPKTSKIEVKDKWKLSDDGQTLKVDRSVHSAEGSGTVHLIFQKQPTGARRTAVPRQ